MRTRSAELISGRLFALNLASRFLCCVWYVSSHPRHPTYCLSAAGVMTPLTGILHRSTTVCSSLASSPLQKAPFLCTLAHMHIHIHIRGQYTQTTHSKRVVAGPMAVRFDCYSELQNLVVPSLPSLSAGLDELLLFSWNFCTL